MADQTVDGFPMVQLEYEGKVVYAALLDDRCRLVDDMSNQLRMWLRPMPNEGDRKNLQNYCASLGFATEFIW